VHFSLSRRGALLSTRVTPLNAAQFAAKRSKNVSNQENFAAVPSPLISTHGNTGNAGELLSEWPSKIRQAKSSVAALSTRDLARFIRLINAVGSYLRIRYVDRIIEDDQ
jgi:hypothetical protein